MKAYVILIKEIKNEKCVDKWYLKNNAYPGTQLYFNKDLALQEAKFWTFNVKDSEGSHRLEATIKQYKEEESYI
jgi:hypothetical protein